MDEDPIKNRDESLQRLILLLRSIEGAQVTLIGDTMLDRYHHGFANNLNSTAPVPVLKIIRSEESAGASAHIAIGLTSFGMKVSFHTFVGQDSEGEAVLSSLKTSEVDVENIVSIPDRKTLTKIRFFGSRESLLDREQILLQADRGPNESLDPDISTMLTSNAMASMNDSCALVISDYDKGVVSEEGAQKLIKKANDLGIPSIVDPKLTGLDKSKGATVVIFEKRGLSLLTRRMNAKNDEDAGKKLLKEYDWNSILVLGGIDGVYLHHKDGASIHMPCMAPVARQQIGMHDAAAASLAAALGAELSLHDAALLASAACECVLSASTSQEYIDSSTLTLWLDELSWQMRISDR